jgi:hypothetical protein
MACFMKQVITALCVCWWPTAWAVSLLLGQGVCSFCRRSLTASMYRLLLCHHSPNCWPSCRLLV